MKKIKTLSTFFSSIIISSLLFYSLNCTSIPYTFSKFKVVQITHINKPEFEASEAYFSPDCTTLIFQGKFKGDKTLEIYTYNLLTHKFKKLLTTNGKEVCTYFSPDGKKILFASTMDHPTDKNDIAYYGTMWPYDHSFEIYIANADGTNVQRITYNKSYEAEGSFSPDGRKLLYTSDRDGNLELYTLDLQTMKETRITHTPQLNEGGAFFSPDGTKIVCRAWKLPKEKSKKFRIKEAHIYLMNADGSNVKQLTHGQSFNWSPFFSHDGKYIYFASNRNNKNRINYDIYRMDIDGRNLELIYATPYFDSYPTASPNGKMLSLTSYINKISNLYILYLNKPNSLKK